MSKLMRLFVVLGLASSLFACSIYQAPDGAPNLAFSGYWSASNGLFNSDSEISNDWWLRFDDPVLNALVDQALAENRDVQSSIARVEQARAYLGLEEWAYLPTGHMDLTRDRGAFPESGPNAADRYHTGIGLNWELDLFGRVRNANRIALAELNGSYSNARAIRLLIASEVTNTYYLARVTQERYQMQRQAVLDQQEISELTRVLVEEQREAQDVLEQSLAELAKLEVELLFEEEYERRLEHRLATLLGQQPAHWRLPQPTEHDSPLRLDPVAIGDVSLLLQTRPDIQIAEQKLVAQQAAVGIAKASYFPSLSLSGYFGFIAGSSGDLGATGSESWFVGPRLHWNALDFGRTRHQINAAQTGVEAALAEYEGTVLRAIEETENALLRFTTAHSEIPHRESQRRHANAAANAATARYEEGMGSYLEVLIARRDALRSEIDHVNSLASQRVALVDVFRALGAAPR